MHMSFVSFVARISRLSTPLFCHQSRLTVSHPFAVGAIVRQEVPIMKVARRAACHQVVAAESPPLTLVSPCQTPVQDQKLKGYDYLPACDSSPVRWGSVKLILDKHRQSSVAAQATSNGAIASSTASIAHNAAGNTGVAKAVPPVRKRIMKKSVDNDNRASNGSNAQMMDASQKAAMAKFSKFVQDQLKPEQTRIHEDLAAARAEFLHSSLDAEAWADLKSQNRTGPKRKLRETLPLRQARLLERLKAAAFDLIHAGIDGDILSKMHAQLGLDQFESMPSSLLPVMAASSSQPLQDRDGTIPRKRCEFCHDLSASDGSEPSDLKQDVAALERALAKSRQSNARFVEENLRMQLQLQCSSSSSHTTMAGRQPSFQFASG